MNPTLHNSLAGFNGSNRCDKSSPEAFIQSWRARMTQLKRTEILDLESSIHHEAVQTAADFLHTKQLKTENPSLTYSCTPASKKWKFVFNPSTNSYVVVRK